MQNLYITLSTSDEFYVTGLKKTESEDFDWKKVTVYTLVYGQNTSLTKDYNPSWFFGRYNSVYVSLINNTLSNI